MSPCRPSLLRRARVRCWTSREQSTHPRLHSRTTLSLPSSRLHHGLRAPRRHRLSLRSLMCLDDGGAPVRLAGCRSRRSWCCGCRQHCMLGSRRARPRVGCGCWMSCWMRWRPWMTSSWSRSSGGASRPRGGRGDSSGRPPARRRRVMCPVPRRRYAARCPRSSRCSMSLWRLRVLAAALPSLLRCWITNCQRVPALCDDGPRMTQSRCVRRQHASTVI